MNIVDVMENGTPEPDTSNLTVDASGSLTVNHIEGLADQLTYTYRGQPPEAVASDNIGDIIRYEDLHRRLLNFDTGPLYYREHYAGFYLKPKKTKVKKSHLPDWW